MNALDELREMGVDSRIMATDGDYALMPAGHPLVGCEHLVSCCCILEGAPEDLFEENSISPAPLAERLLSRAEEIDGTAVLDASQFLVALGFRAPTCAQVGLRAVEHLVAKSPEEPLWAAYRVALQAAEGQEGAKGQAIDILVGPSQGLPFVLAVLALRLLGEEDSARFAVQSRIAQDKDEDGLAAHLYDNWDNGSHFFPMVSNRLVSREVR